MANVRVVERWLVAERGPGPNKERTWSPHRDRLISLQLNSSAPRGLFSHQPTNWPFGLPRSGAQILGVTRPPSTLEKHQILNIAINSVKKISCLLSVSRWNEINVCVPLGLYISHWQTADFPDSAWRRHLTWGKCDFKTELYLLYPSITFTPLPINEASLFMFAIYKPEWFSEMWASVYDFVPLNINLLVCVFYFLW